MNFCGIEDQEFNTIEKYKNRSLSILILFYGIEFIKGAI